jgi:hypothetical protein
MISRLMPVWVAAPLLLGYGLVEGWWTNRWHGSDDFQTVAAQLDTLPMVLVNWTARPLELTERERAIGQIKAWSYRRYLDSTSGKAITVLVVCGRPGPVAAHAPDVCFSGAGYKPTGEPVRRTLDGGAETWTGAFRKDTGPVPDFLRVTWSWNATGAWEASSSPRLAFARYPILVKLYVLQHATVPDEASAKETCDAFLAVLLPELQQRLFPNKQ